MSTHTGASPSDAAAEPATQLANGATQADSQNEARTPQETQPQGATIIHRRALSHLAQGMAAAELGVPTSHVRTEVSDDGGELAVSISGPLRDLGDSGTVAQAAHGIRDRIATQMTDLANRRVGRVDLHLIEVRTRPVISPATDRALPEDELEQPDPGHNRNTGARDERRLLRQATHRSRRFTVAIILLIPAASLTWIGIEAGLQLAGADALVMAPDELLLQLEALDHIQRSVAGGVLLALSLIGLLLALAPGRRPRRVAQTSSSSGTQQHVIVDDALLARSMSHRVAGPEISPTATRTSLGRTTSITTVHRYSGMDVSTDEMQQRLDRFVGDLHLRPALDCRVEVAREGVLP